MFSLYLTKMNIHIDNFDMSEISVELLNRMVYLHSYLENDWTIKKRDGCYIMTKESNKIIISDSCDYSKLKINKDSVNKCISNKCTTNKCSGNKMNTNTCGNDNNHYEDTNDMRYILYFLYNVLNNGWSIKKSQYTEYVFIKNHEGKKEYFSNKYLHTFLKDNFKLNLIK
jgi:hypothetical protein